MSIERIGGDSSNQGQGLTGPWEGLAVASTNDGEQQPDGVEGYSDVQDDETQELGGPMTPWRLNAIRNEITKVRNEYLEEVARRRAENKAPTDGEDLHTKEALQTAQAVIKEKYLERM